MNITPETKTNEWLRWFEAVLEVNGGDEAQARRIADSNVPTPVAHMRHLTWADYNRSARGGN